MWSVDYCMFLSRWSLDTSLFTLEEHIRTWVFQCWVLSCPMCHLEYVWILPLSHQLSLRSRKTKPDQPRINTYIWPNWCEQKWSYQWILWIPEAIVWDMTTCTPILTDLVCVYVVTEQIKRGCQQVSPHSENPSLAQHSASGTCLA